jgi:UDP-N-acetylmuramate dehydrogenase
MNAGAFGSETWQFVQSVETINRAGQVKLKTPEDYKVGYRSVVSNDKDIEQEWFIAASFRFNSDPGAVEQKRIRELLNQRSATQPIGTRSCGSVFRNPPGDYAARLIESCGLKGKRIGGAHISEKHANFIINDEAAKADDIEQLINLIQMTVEEKANIKLKTEVAIVGEPL